MSKIGNVVSKTWANVREGFRHFLPFHVGAVALAVCDILNIHDSMPDKMFTHVLRGIFWGMLAGVVTRLAADRGRLRFGAAASWVATLLVAALGTWFWFDISDSSRYYWVWSMLYWGTTFALAASCMTMLYERENECTLFAQLLFQFHVVAVSAVIVVLGLVGCISAFDKLIAPIPREIYGDASAIVFIAAAPIAFMSLLPRRDSVDEDSQRAGTFLFKLILPTSLVLLGILYLYLIRIVATWSMPSGQLNWFGSTALALYVFFWLVLAKSERKFTQFVIRRGWMLLVPVVAAQVVAVWIRYRAYGLTAERMAGMITLALGIYALVLAAFNGRRVWFFRVMAVAGLVFTITPLNFMDVPVWNQERRLHDALERIGCFDGGEFSVPDAIQMADADAKIIVGAWDYLQKAHTVWHAAEFKRKIFDATNGELFDKLSLDPSKIPGLRQRHSAGRWTRCISEGTFKIDGYSSLYVFEGYNAFDSRFQIINGDEHWILSFSTNANYAVEGDFDVTDKIRAIVDSIPMEKRYDNTCQIDASLCLWELKPGVVLGFKGATLYWSNDNDNDSPFFLFDCFLLQK